MDAWRRDSPDRRDDPHPRRHPYMGSGRVVTYPEEAPVHGVTVDGFWIDATPVTNAFRTLRTGHRLCHLGRDRSGSKDYPGARPWHAEGGRARSRRLNSPSIFRTGGGGGASPGGAMASAVWRGQPHRRARRPSGGAGRLQGRGRPMRHGPARRCPPKPMEIARARGGLDGAEFAWGDELTPGGRHMANTWQEPSENLQERRLARTSPADVSAERLRHLRHDRKCLGVDRRLVFAAARGRCGESPLRAPEPMGGAIEGSHDPTTGCVSRAGS